MIICSFASRFCTSSYPSRCSAKTSWAYLGEIIYHLIGTDLLLSIFERQFWKGVLLVLKQCSKDCIVISGRLKTFVDRWPYMGVFAVWGDIRMCHWPRRRVYGTQCKCKCWFCFRLSCKLVGWLTIAKSQALKIFYRGGGRWRGKCQLGRCTNQRGCAWVWTRQKVFQLCLKGGK